MKFYGHKSSAFGFAYQNPDRRRQSNAYDILVRAGRKRERQSAKKECLAGIDDYEYSILEFWQDDEWYSELHYDDDYDYDYDYDDWNDDFGDEDEDNCQEDFGWYDECY